MKKRAISMIIALVMVLSWMLPANGATALAAQGTSSVGLEPAPVGATVIEKVYIDDLSSNDLDTMLPAYAGYMTKAIGLF